MNARRLIESVLRGEYWIYPDGDVYYCDGDVGPVNHEGVALDHAQRELLDYMAIDAGNDEWVDWDETTANAKREYLEGATPEEAAEIEEQGLSDADVLELLAAKLKVSSTVVDAALNRVDLRQYAMREWGWHALRGDQVETWEISEKSLLAIARGIDAALDESVGGDEVDPNAEFWINAYKGHRALKLTYQQIESRDFGAEFQTPPTAPSQQMRKLDQQQVPDFYKGKIGDSARQIVSTLIETSEDEGYASALDFFERRDEQMREILGEFEAKKGQGKISWKRIPEQPLSQIWLVYGKRGTIFDEEGLNKIAEQAKNLIARFYASTEICGHTQAGADDQIEDYFGRALTDAEKAPLYDMLTDEKGSWLLSDYAFKWLHPFYDQLCRAKTAEEKLLVLDKIFNVVHQRSDLAGVFVQGGIATLNKIADQGGYTTPDDKHEQKQAWTTRTRSPY